MISLQTGVKCIDIDLICVGADEVLQSFAHGYHHRHRYKEVENILWSASVSSSIFTNAAGQYLVLPVPRACDHHHRAFQCCSPHGVAARSVVRILF